MANTTPILIAGCGNVAAGDDAFGPLVIRALRNEDLAGAEAINLDLRPAALLDHLADRVSLVLVDAAYGDGLAAGRVMSVNWFSPERPELVDDDVMSTHGLSIANQLELADALGMLPARVRLIAGILPPPAADRAAHIDLMEMVDDATARILQYIRNEQRQATLGALTGATFHA